MRPFPASVLAFAVFLAQSAALSAQAVYVTSDANDPVYSDKPQPGSREVSLKPLNVVVFPNDSDRLPASDAAGKGASAKQEKAVIEYKRFSVLSPEENGSVAANSALFEVRLAVDPPLQLREGHAFVVSINGKPVGRRFTATEFMIPPEFWGDQLPPENQEMQLDAGIVDADGNLLQRAAPVRFFMRHVTIRPPPRWRFAPPDRFRRTEHAWDRPPGKPTKDAAKENEATAAKSRKADK